MRLLMKAVQRALHGTCIDRIRMPTTMGACSDADTPKREGDSTR